MSKSDSLPEEVDVFIDKYADTFISNLPKERQGRREALFAAIRESGMSRWGCCLALEEFGNVYSELSLRYEHSLDCGFPKKKRDFWRSERQHYYAWRNYFRDTTTVALSFIWDLSAGGTAGGTFQAVWKYDLTDLDYQDLKLLSDTLAGKDEEMLCCNRVSLSMLEEWMADMCDRVKTLENRYNDTDGVLRLPESMGISEQELSGMSGILSQDTGLFKEWIESRNALSRHLSRKARKTYDAMTESIIRSRIYLGSEI